MSKASFAVHFAVFHVLRRTSETVNYSLEKRQGLPADLKKVLIKSMGPPWNPVFPVVSALCRHLIRVLLRSEWSLSEIAFRIIRST